MTVTWEVIAIVAGLAAAALTAGTLFAFSNFIMRALGKLPYAEGVSAMQSINEEAPNPTFIVAIFGGAVASLPVLAVERGQLGEASTQLLAAAVVLSVFSTAVTLGFNVPRNNRLDRLTPDSPAVESYWAEYLRSWTRGNTVRALASLASAVAYALSLRGR